jgi:hypothetical protein
MYYELVTQCDVCCLTYIVQLERSILLRKHSATYHTLLFYFYFYFIFKSGLLSVEAGPHVGLYIVVRYHTLHYIVYRTSYMITRLHGASIAL